MMFLALLHEAWISIGGSRLRTFLAMLGIVIGVSSVVLMLAIGAGSQRTVEENIARLGNNLLMVTPGGINNKGVFNGGILAFSSRDIDAIAQLPSVQDIAPSTYPRSFQISDGKHNREVMVVGTTASYFTIRNWEFSDGAAFSGDDMRLLHRVTIIGASVAAKMFPRETAQGIYIIGRIIHINGIPFHIIGILKSKGAGSDGRDLDDSTYVPITTAKSALWGSAFMLGLAQVMYVQATDNAGVDQASDDIFTVLRENYHLHGTQGNNFSIRNLSAVLQAAADTSKAFSILLGAIASISLMVGGIGIMNIMLVTVTERTREIGIRKAIGATEQQILLQFLLEAVIISCIGSIIGLVVGFCCGIGAESLFMIPVSYSRWIVALVLGVAGMVGIASGLYPAYKAARLQPIDALHI